MLALPFPYRLPRPRLGPLGHSALPFQGGLHEPQVEAARTCPREKLTSEQVHSESPVNFQLANARQEVNRACPVTQNIGTAIFRLQKLQK